jgi:hypothetical protein
LIIKAALAAIKKHKALLTRQAKNFASRFKIRVDKLTVAQDKLSISLDTLPLTLPEPLVKPNLRQFPSSRKRAMTAHKAADAKEQDKARQRQRAAIQAQDKHNQNSF